MKIDMLMDNFAGIMKTSNEKIEIMTQEYPNKAIKVEKRLASKMILNPGQHTLQKRAGYIVAKSVQLVPQYKRPRSKSPLAIYAPEKQKLEQGSSYKVEEYSPTQTPLRIDGKVSLREQLRKMRGERDIMATTTNIEEGVPEEPPMPTLVRKQIL